MSPASREVLCFLGLTRSQKGMKELFQTECKLKNAANPAQKEKYEKEIKQEVKKLQKIRDFVKQKDAEKDVKDMDRLNEIR